MFEFDGNKKPMLCLHGLPTKAKPDPIVDLIAVLSESNVGIQLPKMEKVPELVTFSYCAGSEWKKYDITLNGKIYSLYQNKCVFGLTKTEVILSFVVKDKTSDSKTFYEDLIGEVLTGEDVKSLAWLLAVGSSITGRRLTALKISSKLEKINAVMAFSPVLQVETSNSLSPKTMYVESRDLYGVVDLNTVESVTIRKVEDTINVVFSTKEKTDYTLELD